MKRGCKLMVVVEVDKIETSDHMSRMGKILQEQIENTLSSKKENDVLVVILAEGARIQKVFQLGGGQKVREVQVTTEEPAPMTLKRARKRW